MRGIYLSNINLQDKASGVSKKINMQLLAFKKNNIDICAPDLSISNNFERYLNIVLGACPLLPTLFTVKFKKIITNINITKIDFIYIRKTTIDKSYVDLLEKIKNINPNIKILMEIPTYPYDKEFKSIFSKTLLLKDKKYRKGLKGIIDRIITFSNDEYIFGIPTINISNAIDFENSRAKNISNYDNNIINIIAVAQFSFWHGYDRFLKGLSTYYKYGGDRIIILHFVGNGSEIKKYKNIVKKNRLEDYVIFHGEKFGEDLDKIYDKCEIALDSMGRHRSGVYFNSSLKGKEYGMKGLPIISGVETELDKQPNYRYYMRVDADESEIDMELVIKFYEQIYNGKESKHEIIENIRQFTKKQFNINMTIQPILDFLCK